jgi:hypothetical protein
MTPRTPNLHERLVVDISKQSCFLLFRRAVLGLVATLVALEPSPSVTAPVMPASRARGAAIVVNVVVTKFFSTGIFKISVVTDKREYQIYRKFIGDTKKLSDKIYKK